MDDKVFDLITKIYSEVQGIKSEMQDIKIEMKDMKADITKIVIGQEKIQTDIQIIAEVQKSHMQRNANQHTEIVEMLSSKIDLAEGAIRKISAVK
jgi:hypothetical protein